MQCPACGACRHRCARIQIGGRPYVVETNRPSAPRVRGWGDSPEHNKTSEWRRGFRQRDHPLEVALMAPSAVHEHSDCRAMRSHEQYTSSVHQAFIGWYLACLVRRRSNNPPSPGSLTIASAVVWKPSINGCLDKAGRKEGERDCHVHLSHTASFAACDAFSFTAGSVMSS